jgi:hypothetical protein
MKSITTTLLLSVLATSAFAQEAPKNPCHQPVMPNAQSSDMVIKYFNKHMLEYKSCIDIFVAEQRAIVKANETTDAPKAKQAFDAAEVAQKEYNAMVDELNAQKPQEEK